MGVATQLFSAHFKSTKSIPPIGSIRNVRSFVVHTARESMRHCRAGPICNQCEFLSHFPSRLYPLPFPWVGITLAIINRWDLHKKFRFVFLRKFLCKSIFAFCNTEYEYLQRIYENLHFCSNKFSYFHINKISQKYLLFVTMKKLNNRF